MVVIIFILFFNNRVQAILKLGITFMAIDLGLLLIAELRFHQTLKFHNSLLQLDYDLGCKQPDYHYQNQQND